MQGQSYLFVLFTYRNSTSLVMLVTSEEELASQTRGRRWLKLHNVLTAHPDLQP